MKTVFWYATLGASIGRGDRIEGLLTVEDYISTVDLLRSPHDSIPATYGARCMSRRTRQLPRAVMLLTSQPISSTGAELERWRHSHGVYTCPLGGCSASSDQESPGPFVSHSMKMMGALHLISSLLRLSWHILGTKHLGHWSEPVKGRGPLLCHHHPPPPEPCCPDNPWETRAAFWAYPPTPWS